MNARREPVQGYQYIVTMSSEERQLLLDGLRRFASALSIPEEQAALSSLINTLREPVRDV